MADYVTSTSLTGTCSCCGGATPCECALLIPPFASPYADYATAEAVAEALRIGMHPFKGTVTVSAQSIAVGYLGLESEMEDPEPLQDGKQRPVYSIQQTWSACIAEPTS